MLNHLPFCFLKRKRSETDDKAEDSKNASKQEIVPYKPSAKLTEKKEGLLVRAFRRIKRRLVGDCPPSVAAICLYKTPGNGRKQCRYKMTPQLTEKQSFDSLLPRSYVLNAFVDVRESRNFEFKTGGGSYPVSVLPEHIRKYGSAFLNCDGGILIAGILDNGQIRGVYCDGYMEDRILDIVYNELAEFYPPVPRSMYSIKFLPVYNKHTRRYLRDYRIVEIIFKAGDPLALYECGEHKVFLKREGSVEGPLSPLQIKDLVLRKYRTVLAERRQQNTTLLSP